MDIVKQNPILLKHHINIQTHQKRQLNKTPLKFQKQTSKRAQIQTHLEGEETEEEGLGFQPMIEPIRPAMRSVAKAMHAARRSLTLAPLSRSRSRIGGERLR